MKPTAIAVWFPTVRTGTGTDIFTQRLVCQLRAQGIRAHITWLPLRAEYAPWTVSVPKPPAWARLVHVNTWLHPRFLPRGLPVVATLHHAVHHPDLRRYKGNLRAAYHRFWIAPRERRIMRRAARVVAVSRFVADTAKRTLVGVPADVIYNGVDTRFFRPGERKRRPDEPFRLLYVGSWSARKGVDLLGPIMDELGDEFELFYTAGGVVGEKMPRNTHDLGRLVGSDAVVAAMQSADALLFPSRSEGLPLSVIEAMACGLPVIATRGSSLSEIVHDDVTGITCRQDDVLEFARAIRRLAHENGLCSSLAENARQAALSRYSAATVLNAYISIYGDMVQHGKRA
ncbi:glycosyltransferase family 4 protein [Salinisphaera sp. S4-8]|uniref:glycosyltransferase family 4 protein n=1 Tax=Salinisphaera sp. S4-8 TaxID=633357 RepID=UPI0033411A5C